MPTTQRLPPPSLRSRHQRSSNNQALLKTAKSWLINTSRKPETCPISTVTHLITTNTSVGKTILCKYDPGKLHSLYAIMRDMERNYMVAELREEVQLRLERAQTWREVGDLAAAQAGEEWKALRAACQDALANCEQLRERLERCEREFEAGGLPPGALAGEQRVWNMEAEIRSGRLEGEERGRGLSPK